MRRGKAWRSCVAPGAGARAQRDWVHAALTTRRPRLLAVGFKTKLRDVLDVAGFTALLEELDVRIVHMEPDNLVKLAVSSITAKRLAQATGRHNLLDERQRLPPVHIDPREFSKNLARREDLQLALRGYVAKLDRPVLRITCERLLADEAATLAAIFAFLGVPPGPTTSRVRKNTSDDLRQTVVNFDDLRAAYAATRYASMFDEGARAYP